MSEAGRAHRVWAWFQDIEMDEGVFDELGGDFEREHPVACSRVGEVESRLFSQRAAVDSQSPGSAPEDTDRATFPSTDNRARLA